MVRLPWNYEHATNGYLALGHELCRLKWNAISHRRGNTIARSNSATHTNTTTTHFLSTGLTYLKVEGGGTGVRGQHAPSPSPVTTRGDPPPPLQPPSSFLSTHTTLFPGRIPLELRNTQRDYSEYSQLLPRPLLRCQPPFRQHGTPFELGRLTQSNKRPTNFTHKLPQSRY